MRGDGAPYVGQGLRRREDPVLIRGAGTFTGDLRLDAPLHLAFVRSPVARGRLVSVDRDDAAEMPGVVAIHLRDDLGEIGQLAVNPVIPLHDLPDFPVLAGGEVCSVGQPVAAVLAETLAEAQDAAEAVFPEIEDLALEAPREVARQSWQSGDVAAAFAKADRVVSVRLQHPRLAPSPMEPRAIAVAYDAATDGVTVWQSSQTPHRTRNALSDILGVERARIRVIAPHVGGAFGMKASLYPEEVFAVWAALHHRRDVKWSSTRSEDFLAATHGRGVTSSGELALDAAGTFLALRAEAVGPVGHWLPESGLVTSWNAARVLPSGYRVEALDVTARAQLHNTGLTGIYRGAGRPEANCLMERLIDKAAAELSVDPLDLRRRNLLRPSDLPHETGTGNLLDSGDYAAALDQLERAVDWPALIADRDRRRGEGELVGVGIGFYVEPSGSGWESARVTLGTDGTATVESGSSSQGHGRETAFAQIAADALGLHPDEITVTCGDTATCPEGIGALASRSTAIGGSAVLQACRKVLDEPRRADHPVSAEIVYETAGEAWGYGAYLILLSIDRDTGVPRIEQAHCIDDAGTVINPVMVAGQIMGGFAQGIGEALHEAVIYDDDGQLLTGSFMDYGVPRAKDVPPLGITKTATPSPNNPLGAKGVGEAGTIGAPAAILNAAIDALSPLNPPDIDQLRMPLTSHQLWRQIRAAS